MTQVKLKMIRAETKVLDEDSGTLEAVVSTESVDRDGDIVRARGWDLAHFNKHPVLLSSHNYGSLKSQIGEWTSMDVKGKKLIGTAKYYIDSGNDEADWGFELAKRGRAAFSVGFIPDMEKAKPIDGKDSFFGPMEFIGQELLEVSHVTVPANADALQRMKGMSLDPVIQGILDEMDDGEGVDGYAEIAKAVAEILEPRFAEINDLIKGIEAAKETPRGSASAKEELIALLEAR